jgi:hypothetical protein
VRKKGLRHSSSGLAFGMMFLLKWEERYSLWNRLVAFLWPHRLTTLLGKQVGEGIGHTLDAVAIINIKTLICQSGRNCGITRLTYFVERFIPSDKFLLLN